MHAPARAKRGHSTLSSRGAILLFTSLLILALLSTSTLVCADEERPTSVPAHGSANGIQTPQRPAESPSGERAGASPANAWRPEPSEDPLHPIQREMRPFIEDMFEHALDGYLTHAFPADELMPISGQGRQTMGGIWTTLIDSLDTVALMGRPRLFRRLARWVEEKVSFDLNVSVSVFETSIRQLGGLLAAHFMYEEGIVEVVPEEHAYDGGLLRLAVELADRLMPAFDTPTGVPYGSINLRYGVAPNESSLTATAASGTYLMEMIVLSRATGDSRYEWAARRASQAVFDLRDRTTQLMGNHIDVVTGTWKVVGASVGSGADSTLEYWIKAHAMSGEAGEWDRYETLRRASSRHLRRGGFYLQTIMSQPSIVNNRPFHCSLASFYPGCLLHGGRAEEAVESVWSAHALFKYTGAIPEEFHLRAESDLSRMSSTGFPLRPEHVESIYHLYRATGDPAYLRMGREFAHALHLRTRAPYGFAELGSSLFPHLRGHQKDKMESFLISETLKYLYLLFDECSPIHLPSRLSGASRKVCPRDADVRVRRSSHISMVGWVFTTEAHPLPNTMEWLTPASAMDRQKAMPPGLVGSPFAKGQEQGSALGEDVYTGSMAERFFSKVYSWQPAPLNISLTELAQEDLTWHAARRLEPFTESLAQARRRTLASMIRRYRTDTNPGAAVRDEVGVSHEELAMSDPGSRFFCSNHASHGLDRLSKSVYRESVSPLDY